MVISSVLAWLQNSRAAYPQKIAVSDAETKISYETLWRKACAAGLEIHKRLGGKRNRPVFVCIGRNAESVAAFFGVLASGNFYVPVDPVLPDKRLSDIYDTMRPEMIIVTEPLKKGLPFPEEKIVSWEKLSRAAGKEFSGTLPEAFSSSASAEKIVGAASESGENAQWIGEVSEGAEFEESELFVQRTIDRSLDTDPAYCIFTSGSTGVPKGVLISHRSIIDMADQFAETFSLNDSQAFGNQAPFDFDVSVKDIFLTMRCGASMHILEKSLFMMPKKLMERLNQFGVNTLIWAASAMKIVSVLKTFESIVPEDLRLVMFSGEALPCKVLNDWRRHLPKVCFVNLYGPTEITCNCTYYIIDREFQDSDSIPAGRPFGNSGVFLLVSGEEAEPTEQESRQRGTSAEAESGQADRSAEMESGQAGESTTERPERIDRSMEAEPRVTVERHIGEAEPVGSRAVTTPGSIGEICVRGTCLALGYYGMPEKTREAFCQNPLQTDWPERIYRTGDLGRWDKDGNLHFVGRADTQIKHMGHRIELGELETAANSIGFIGSAACLYHQQKEKICLFYQAELQDDKAVFSELKKILPGYMVPNKLFYLDKMPENRTGKIDRVFLRREYLEKM